MKKIPTYVTKSANENISILKLDIIYVLEFSHLYTSSSYRIQVMTIVILGFVPLLVLQVYPKNPPKLE